MTRPPMGHRDMPPSLWPEIGIVLVEGLVFVALCVVIVTLLILTSPAGPS